MARIPPILLKAGIWMPYFSSSLFMLLISSSEREREREKTKQKEQIDRAEVKKGKKGSGSRLG